MSHESAGEAKKLWAAICDLLRRDLSGTTMSTFFDGAEAVAFADSTLFVLVGGVVARDNIVRNHMPRVMDALQELAGEGAQLRLFTSEEERDQTLRELGVSVPASSGVSSAPAAGSDPGRFAPGEFTFENFVVGNSNRFAYAAARAVAEGKTHTYNPLFIYGGSGLGKTHLLSAIADTRRRQDPSCRILYTRSEDFANELIAQIREGRLREGGAEEFRQKFRSPDLLLVDDVQFFGGKDSTQEEFFNTFNTIYDRGGQIVMTSDRPPKDVARLDERLRTRFEWGVIADIQPPDLETRTAIIGEKAAVLGLDLNPAVTDFIAENITANVRQIEGVVKKLQAYSMLLGETVNIQTASKAIGDIFTENPVATPESIISATEKFFGLEEGALSSKKRDAQTSHARHVAIYLIRTLTKLSLPEIGRVFDRHHSTVMHSVDVVEEERRADSKFDSDIKDLIFNITGHA